MKILIAVFSWLLLSSCSLKSSVKISPTPTMTPQTPITQNPSVTVPDTDSVVALKTNKGQIVIKLYSEETPNTVANFLKKTNSGFYNGLTFHRVISGFMAQGGDPTGTGTGGGSQKSELNQIPFKRGSLGLARTPATKEISNDSQFFICFTTEGCQHLTGDYVNFGEVISGLDVLDQIAQGDKIIEITTKTK
ncbi:MAG: hypothetical protein US68_C0002G0003 [Candidatus Shapirobacteria bacterium GW2011_GWE1_38_10]|uniref:Peptidyl-prolyl cis-trans isomerase n=1 Tax=Candidatus Shapirobacteria bacterium GW2011_GWE1_38_10 TaxID=1618488 RepID=A0A0G0LDL0_9BACT|nr:MAG: hypothetical protein US46_C0010G0007 [Candidatus Shapirobacteria bacterium GW2011_GWF2_37_20]KKQ50726.1 MAG: hypothetical protein US68_C0002G0003 [Candidatus Shapirobacteria bacterium GW2011_GWE1_38_10]KKQ64475.1 MAG: hypothetical protein US85_C0008G0004 [Candidatus Shapirobacteria bacterium GW2011_GWF1_38_23]